MKPDYWQDAITHLSQKDKVMALLIKQFSNITLQSRGDAFSTLVRSVVGQQISVLAADSVWQKMEKLLIDITYQTVLKIDEQTLKACGLSKQKVNYIINIANYFSINNIDKSYFKQKDYLHISEELMAIKGIGLWTVEMFAIFYLLQPNIFPKKDLGLIKAINIHYNQGKSYALSEKKIDEISQQWQPYRTVATWFLWRSIDEKVVEY